MAAAGDIQDLCEEATCPICLDYFMDPVTIAECGHNFCRTCLAQSWREEEEEEGDAALVGSCPQCRGSAQRKSLIPNRALKNVVEIAKKLRLGGQGGASEAEGVCEQHQEPLKLFCKDHQAPICLVCVTSREHESHKVVPWEEACQEYKDQIASRLKILRAEREKILTYKADAEKESQDLLNQTEEERQKTKAELRQIHQFLEEQEKILLAQIEEVEKEIARRRDEHVARLCRELSTLENVIQEMEENCQQPTCEFLQDVRRTLQRSEKKEAFENPVAFPPELTSKIRELSDRKPLLEGVVRQFQVVGAPLKLPSSYRAGASKVTSDVGAPDGQQPATKPGLGPMSCFGACFSLDGSVAPPAFGSSTAQTPFGESGPLVSFGAKSTQPVFGATTSVFSFGTATTSAVSSFGAATQSTSGDAGAIIGGSAPFQFTFRAPNQLAAAGGACGLRAAVGGSAGGPAVDFSFGSGQGEAAPPSGSSIAQPPLSSQNQGAPSAFSIPGTTHESKPAFGGAPTPTFGQGLPTPGGGTAGRPPSLRNPITSAFGSTSGSTTPTIGTEPKTRHLKLLLPLRRNTHRK
ncbi:zinc finger protein RFP-like [Tiliqua scincoides]|uniref:zinc finger protein RFP-like n=1 Tax=Tiliqua scincoides TaxID=71010 RepID=UPI00346360B6